MQLKKLDYIWLTLSSFAIFGLVEKNRIQINEIELTEGKLFHEARCKELFYNIDSTSICFKYIKTESSPPNFYELQKMTDSLCSWTKNSIPTLSEKIKNNDSIKIQVPHFNDAFLTQYTNRTENTINEYNESLTKVLRLNKEAKVGNLQLVIQMLSPLLLIIGLAIRFSKTALEIRIEKNTN